MLTRNNIKKILSLLLLAALIVGQSAGGFAQAKAKGYQFTYKKVTVYMGGPAAKLIKKAGKGTEYVNGITFLTNKVSTKEKIKIGSSYSAVKKKYGNKKDYLGVYTYKKGGSKLQVEVTDDVVTNIRYIKA